MFRTDLQTRPYTDIPKMPGGGVFGHLLAMRDDPLGVFGEVRARHGDIVRVRVGHREILCLYKPEDVQHVLINNASNYAKATRGYALIRILLGQGVLTAEGEHWRKQRRTMQPAFHRKVLGNFADSMVRNSADLVSRWHPVADAGLSVDVHGAMNTLTLRIICDVLFSGGLGDQEAVIDRELTALLDGFEHMATAPWPKPEYVPTPKALRWHLGRFRLYRLVDKLIAQRRASGEDGADLLGMLMSARDEETGEGMSDRQLREEILTLILAGHETTANALSWTLMLLAQRPDIAAKLEAEVDTVLGGRQATLEDYRALTYADRVLRESMRLYPPAWLASRAAKSDDVIGGYRIPAGSFLFMCQHTIHRHPDYWDRPHVFDPDRWTKERSEGREKLAYFPFGAGQRKCIGEPFALMEARLALATIVQKYRFHLVPGHPIAMEPSVTLRPRDGLKMILERRGEIQRG